MLSALLFFALAAASQHPVCVSSLGEIGHVTRYAAVECSSGLRLYWWPGEQGFRTAAPPPEIPLRSYRRRAYRAVLAKGIDIYTTAVAIEAGAREANPVQPSVEHRVGMSMLEVGGVLGLEYLADRRDPSGRWGDRVSKFHLWSRVGLGAWNAYVAFREIRSGKE